MIGLDKVRAEAAAFLARCGRWTAGRADVLAVVLVGSHARSEAGSLRASSTDRLTDAGEPAKFTQVADTDTPLPALPAT